ncbi:hypothetical protein [Verminephrobacter eiseniae]|uniref:PglZ domain-containing protein n=1 Tax=Verminephrobacter eiseniae (strain EF01-2) TaxID=391735 RepID=A1WE32_VEREI|nr:hypothetical protein [Verminephrobacter eiseniae]ABM55889.1 conserved hypothetical protein [Verminephrobacter eiseniae EF01-2]MCW5286269.1 hypothetical protein [Verminephrobacter eiseniae]MCW5304568.1 hypothetical protein [Verminephrobacter eiseniae]MCW8179862.1 hypothetical protein [Verminephrobacter eiseniae]MCW8192338.1 hypothetical protein [Verminephrobacter eiseniae]
MALTAAALHALTQGSDADAWRVIVGHAVEIARKPLAAGNAPSEVVKRDREVGELDLFLSSSGWDLWQAFGNSVERTSDRLVRWWAEPFSAKAVLILDGLSLRELPWLLQGAKEHGFTTREVSAHASELPGATNEFAQALGFGSRSQLRSNGGGLAHKLQPAHTESSDMPWQDCAGLIDGAPNWVFWHHWPDSKMHHLSGAGHGLDTLARDAAERLGSNDFWAFVERLATGRRLVITSDHGYAATGDFSDADGEVKRFLKQTFASGRSAKGSGDTGPFMPPVALRINSPHGAHLLALGRWKWKSQSGYPTLTHGGLSLLEVLSPFVVLSNE